MALSICASHPETATPQQIRPHEPSRVTGLDTPRVNDTHVNRTDRGITDTSTEPCCKKRGPSPKPTSFSYGDQHLVYHDTALGLVCRAVFGVQESNQAVLMVRLVRSLLEANRGQLGASQHIRGHTPLRDAILNPTCPIEVLRMLLETDLNNEAVLMQDGNGLTPVDHLILQVVQNGDASMATAQQRQKVDEAFRVYVDVVETRLSNGCRSQDSALNTSTIPSSSSSSSSSPLIRLLSLNDSQNIENRHLSPGQTCSGKPMDRIMDNARYVIEKNPSRLHDVSTTSGCTVLHVALRNYGNHHGLVEFLLDLDTDNRLVAHRNVFGDLPLHVACLVGVPWEVLRLVLDKTLSAGTNSSRQEPTVPGQAHSLLWSINHAGRTPVDLEWMRHIEGGKGLSESRSFYPLEERGITFQNGRMEDMYRNLLRDAVQQATTAKRFVNGTNSPLDAEETSDVCFGTLLSRILLVVQMAYRSCPSDEVLVANHNGRPDVTRDHLLHAASTLMNPTGPTLPEILSEEDWERLSAAMAERGLPGFMAAKMQPWMQTLMLGMPACAITNPALAKAGLDMRLMQAARAADVPIRSLEGFDELYALIAGGTVEEQLDMLMASLPFAGDSEDQFATTAALYFEENTAAAWEFARIMAFQRADLPADEVEALLAEFKGKLLDTRNRAWMDPILAAEESRIAIAVGALHLMGDTGVLNLLSQAGYTLDRAAFSPPD